MRQPTQSKAAQSGISFMGLLFVCAILASAGVMIARVVPTVIEYQSILKAVNTAKMGSTPTDVRSNFDASKAAGYFDAISGKDLDIVKQNDTYMVSFAYTKEIHMAGPAFLLLKYSGKTN
jgi:hypothetical protein